MDGAGRVFLPSPFFLLVFKMLWQILSLIVDGVLLEVGDYLSLFIRFSGNIPAVELMQFKQIILFAVLIRLTVLYSFGVYQVAWEYSTWNDFVKIFKAAMLGAVLLVAASYFQDVRAYSRLVYILSFVVSTLAICAWRIVVLLIHITLWKSRRSLRKTLVIGHDRGSGSLFKFIEDEWRKGYQPLFINGNKDKDTLLGEISGMYEQEKFKSIFIESELLTPESLLEVLKQFSNKNVPCYITPGRYEQVIRSGHSAQIGIQPFIQTFFISSNESLFVLKNIFEKIMAFFLLVILSPLFITIYLLIKKKDNHNPVYKQARIGKDGRPFRIYKFRTMHGSEIPASEEDFVETLEDSRVTEIGRILRRTGLDELPQLINVLKGEMSFVGPRPEIPPVVERYSDWQKQVLRIKPGITGLAQVTGRKDLTISSKLSLDLYYIQNYSFWLDIKIIFKTFFIILRREGSY